MSIDYINLIGGGNGGSSVDVAAAIEQAENSRLVISGSAALSNPSASWPEAGLGDVLGVVRMPSGSLELWTAVGAGDFGPAPTQVVSGSGGSASSLTNKISTDATPKISQLNLVTGPGNLALPVVTENTQFGIVVFDEPITLPDGKTYPVGSTILIVERNSSWVAIC